MDIGSVNEGPYTVTVGGFGKWKYVAAQDIFIGVNDNSNGDVWVYKPDDWQPVNSLPALNVATLDATTLDATALDMTAETQSLQATDDNPLLADLIDWSDEDGDLLTFGFTDLNSDAGSGSLVLNGVIQTAGQEIVVSEEQLLNGELLWRSEEHTSEERRVGKE